MKSNNKINNTYDIGLRIKNKDNNSKAEELLCKSDSVSVHQRNYQLFLTEICKTVNNLNPILWQIYLLPCMCDKTLVIGGYNSLFLPSVKTMCRPESF